MMDSTFWTARPNSPTIVTIPLKRKLNIFWALYYSYITLLFCSTYVYISNIRLMFNLFLPFFHFPDKPVILQLPSTCVLKDLVVTCRCLVDSNPKAAVTWSVNGTLPPDNYNISVISEPDKVTAVLRGHMDKPQTVICFAVNILGNDSQLLLLKSEEGNFFWFNPLFALHIQKQNLSNTTCVNKSTECLQER